MTRLHVNLKVKELETSVRFYSKLFDTQPTVVKPRYAKWMLDDPRVNFSLVEMPEGTGDIGFEHLGIQAESDAELEELRRRVDGIDGVVFEEGKTECCYHASDKTWVTDSQGVGWELFLTSGEANSLENQPEEGAECCSAECCSDTATAESPAEACCAK